mgnify:FL=1
MLFRSVLEADLVVIATGGRPKDELFFQVQEENIAKEIYNIGDSFTGGKVLEATRAANALGRRI